MSWILARIVRLVPLSWFTPINGAPQSQRLGVAAGLLNSIFRVLQVMVFIFKLCEQNQMMPPTTIVQQAVAQIRSQAKPRQTLSFILNLDMCQRLDDLSQYAMLDSY